MKQRMNHLVRPTSRAPRRRAFTLIELLIVIGLTAVLFALLLIPLVSAIRYTKQAQIVTAAQDAVRITREMLTRELSSAIFVFDGTSHPFLIPGTTPPHPGDDRYTNFLDLQIENSASPTHAQVVGHAYSAKLDFVLPLTNQGPIDPKTGLPLTDPTTNEPITYRASQNGSAIVSNPATVFPLAAGTTMVRYWIGLRDPSQPYSNIYEDRDNSSNTYILYRAQFQPYFAKYDPVTKKQIGVTINTDLFAVRTTVDANGNTVMTPELDDPDFFRYVGATDVNWLDDAHGTYLAQTNPASVTTATADGSPAQHNYRVEKWMQLAKPVIPGQNIDLILLPHNADNTLNFDPPVQPGGTTCSASGVCPGIAHSGVARDPVTNTYYPIINTSVTFRPATVSGDAVPGTTSDYGTQGLPTTAAESGYGYVPTIYTATSKSWSLPFHVSLYPGNYDGSASPAPNTVPFYYATQVSSLTDAPGSGNPPLYNAGDLLEYKYANTTDPNPQLVYNITKGYPIVQNGPGAYKLGGTDFVPFSVNADTGTLNFAAPSFPAGPTGQNRNQNNWNYVYDATADTDATGGVNPMGIIDLTKPYSSPAALTDSPLTNPSVAPGSATGVKDAHLVPGGIRVTGPDLMNGPNQATPTPSMSLPSLTLVPYTEVNATTDLHDNQYSVDYATNHIQLSPDTLQYMKNYPTDPLAKVTVVYNYQANMTLTDPTKGFDASANPYLPMQVKLDYQTRDLIDVSIGVRLYDISTNRAQVIPSETKIKIGNSNRD